MGLRARSCMAAFFQGMQRQNPSRGGRARCSSPAPGGAEVGQEARAADALCAILARCAPNFSDYQGARDTICGADDDDRHSVLGGPTHTYTHTHELFWGSQEVGDARGRGFRTARAAESHAALTRGKHIQLGESGARDHKQRLSS